MVKNITILGSTGSIGCQTLDVIRCNKDKFAVEVLTARKNMVLLAEQIIEFKPKIVSVDGDAERQELLQILGNTFKGEVLTGQEGLKQVAAYGNSDIVLVAVVGVAGLMPTLEAIKAGKTIALANKETLVSGGSIVMPAAEKNNVQILPVDSEHSAIFQCLAGNKAKNVRRLILTASGGPFRTWPRAKIETAKVSEALQHPNWSMGKKVSIDSATMMNKALEVIEARWLFDIDYKAIEVLIHPQSIVHSMVEFVDQSTIAQLSSPSMHLPIQYALSYPDRYDCNLMKPLDLCALSRLEFFPPDNEKFPALTIAIEAAQKGSIYPTVLNAANEIAVNAYIKGQIAFYDIYKAVLTTLEACETVATVSLEDIIHYDQWARTYTKQNILSVRK